jgi:nucleotide-binding universal stress UspA family protein
MIPKIQTVLYATDLSKNSAYAFRYAVNTAQQHDAKIHLLHVIEPLSPRDEALVLAYIDKKEIDRRRKDATENLVQRIEERLKQFAEREYGYYAGRNLTDQRFRLHDREVNHEPKDL